MEATIKFVDSVGTSIRIHSFIPCQPDVGEPATLTRLLSTRSYSPRQVENMVYMGILS